MHLLRVPSHLTLCGVLLLGAISCAHTEAATRRPEPEACERCELSVIAATLAGKEATDCGRTDERAPRPEDAERRTCALQAAQAGRPFLLVEALQGIDSEIAQAFVRTPDGQLLQLWSDSDTAGRARTCRAQVWRTPCRQLASNNMDHGTPLECERAGERVRVCAEGAARGREPGAR